MRKSRPKLDVFGKLIPAKATPAELRGQAVFFGKGRCAECHQAPYYTDNLMHNLQVERFYESRLVNGVRASADGPIKTLPLRGIKDSRRICTTTGCSRWTIRSSSSTSSSGRS